MFVTLTCVTLTPVVRIIESYHENWHGAQTSPLDSNTPKRTTAKADVLIRYISGQFAGKFGSRLRSVGSETRVVVREVRNEILSDCDLRFLSAINQSDASTLRSSPGVTCFGGGPCDQVDAGAGIASR